MKHMAAKSPIINILTYKLNNYELTRQIYNEYQSRYKDALFLINNYKTYSSLKENLKTVELILALSIFHKRVIANLDAAVKFYGTVSRISQAETIKMGSYDLNGLEKNKILGVTMNYYALIEKFSVPATLMDYNETRDFLKKLINLKTNLANAENWTKPKGIRGEEDELPF